MHLLQNIRMQRKRTGHLFLLVFLAVYLASTSIGFLGCSSAIRFDAPLTEKSHSENISPAARTPLPLPLQLLWKNSVNTGFGTGDLRISGDIAMVPAVNGLVYLYDKKSGDDVGHVAVRGSIVGTPEIVNQYLLVPMSSPFTSLTCIDHRTKKYFWSKELGPIESSPLILDSACIVSTLTGMVVKIRIADSTTLWTATLPKAIYSSPVSDGKNIIVGCNDGLLYALDRRDGRIVWKYSASQAIMASPIVADSVVYVGSLDHFLYAIRASDGSLLWKKNIGSPVYSKAAVSSGVVFIGTTAGKMFSLAQSSGEILWTFSARSAITATPLLTSTQLITGSLDHSVYILDRSSGKELWQYKTEGQIRMTPATQDEYLIIASEGGDIYCFGPASMVDTGKGK